MRRHLWTFGPVVLFVAMAAATGLLWQMLPDHHSATFLLLETLVSAAAVAAAAWWVARHRRREIAQDLAHLQALEELTVAIAALSANLRTGQEMLNQLAEMARRLLRFDESCIVLFDATSGTLEIAGHVTTGTLRSGMRFTLDELPVCRASLRDHRTVVIPDIDDTTTPVNVSLVKRTRTRALVAVPLFVEGETVGVLVLGSIVPRQFRASELRLAELVGAHIAVTLVNDRLHRRMVQAIETRDRLATVTAAVYQAKSLDEALNRITEMVPPVLGVDTCSIQLPTATGDEFYIASAPEKHQAWVGRRFPMSDNYVARVMSTGQIVVVNEAEKDPFIAPYSTPEVRLASIAFLPLLQADGTVIGCLTIVCHNVTLFTAEQLKLAEVFSTCAAAALSMARLHERTVHDADTKAMLLRELNHRVKNNLAGIVGLLANRPDDLSDEARLWLDRLTARITVMAHAHELFVGSPQKVRLGDLVDQLLPALAVIRPAGVRFVKQISADQLALSTEKGVALAMVLFELCCNAVIHGLGGRSGTITVRSSSSAGRMAVDVVDDGAGCCRVVHDGNGEPRKECCLARSRAGGLDGWGLRLVDGLVARELRGSFRMNPGVNGGTVATVEFPVIAESGVSSC